MKVRPQTPFFRRPWLLPVLGAVVVTALAAGYIPYRLALQPVSDSEAAQTFVIKPGQSVPDIAAALKDAGLIRNRNAFITYLNLHGLRPRLQAGSYSLSPSQSSQSIAGTIARGRTLTNRLVVPEGYRLAQIRQLAADRGVSAADFDAALQAPHPQAFLATKPANVSLEGYLFPDSYQVSATTTAAGLIDTMLDTFGQRVGPAYADAFQAQGLNLHQAVTIASIVEKEVNIPADRPVVAQIFLKRYHLGMPLGSDVTVDYAAALMGTQFDLSLNSPYNTRKFAGLPPGPICSPGLSALDAVAHPASTDYLYFLTGKDGKTYYGKTLAEHESNIAKHLR